MKLSTILVLSFLFVALVGTLSASYFIYMNSEKTIEAEVSNNLFSDSQFIEDGIENFLQAQERKIELIATQSELSNEELIEMTKIDSAFYDLFVIASNGTVIASSDTERLGLNRANRTYFINAKNQTYINPVYYALVPKEYSISVSTPFHGGVLVGSMKVSSLGDLISDRTGLGQTGESLMAFVNEDNEVVYFTKRLFSDEVLQVVPFNEIPLPMINALSNNESLIFGVKDYRGVEVISVSNYIERIGLGLVTKIDYSEAIGDARNQLIWLSAIILGAVMFIVLILAFLISFRISKPILKLTSGVESITKGDLSMQLEKSNIFEIQGLINSLNRILATMKLAILRTGLNKSDLGIGEAVKAKEEAEEKLKQVTDRLLLATKAGGVGIWDYDVVNNKLVWDDQMYTLYGISPNKFGGAYESWRKGLHPEDTKRGDKEIQMALKGEKNFDTEFRVVWPNGKIHHIRALAIVQRDKSGKPLRMIGTNWDITDLKTNANNNESLKKLGKLKK